MRYGMLCDMFKANAAQRMLFLLLITCGLIPVAAVCPVAADEEPAAFAEMTTAPPPVPRPAENMLREGLEEILARREYRNIHLQNRFNELVAGIVNRVIRWWQDFVGEPIGRLYSNNPWIYWTLVTVLVFLIVGILYHILWVLRSTFSATEKRERGRMVADQLHGTPPEQLLAEADEMAARGEYFLALRRLYLALLLRLDRGDVVRYDPALTNREVARKVRSRPAVSAPFEALSQAAERAWYSVGATSAEEYQNCRRWALEAWEGVEEGA